MIGGTVKETKEEAYIKLVVEDEGEQITIGVEINSHSRSISEGDSVWWQGDKVYWSPKSRKNKYIDNVEDVEIPRIKLKL